MGILKNLKITALLTGMLVAMSTASASLLIEPHLGYNVSGSGDAGTVEYDYNGGQYGLKLGYQNLGLMAGLDFTRSTFELEETEDGVSSKNDMERNELGAFVGYNFPILIRAWAGYYFSNTTKYKASGAEISGDTKEIGIGFTGLPFLSLNVMYRMVTYDEIKFEGVTEAITPNLDAKEIVVGISLPLTL